jgi:hypothetical protein
MAIYEYQKDGKTYYRAYVHARSVTHKVRVQRMQGGLESKAAARREESRLTKEVIAEISRIEGKGYKWMEIIDRWVIDEAFNAGLSVARVKKIKAAINRVFFGELRKDSSRTLKQVRCMEWNFPNLKVK